MSSSYALDDLAASSLPSFTGRSRRGIGGATREYSREYGDPQDSEVDIQGARVERRIAQQPDEEADWNPSRKILHKILRSTGMDIVLGGVIALSLAVVIAETDATQDGEEPPESIRVINIGFTVLYSIELIVRLYVYRWNFFFHWFNVMDFFVVLVDIFLKFFGLSSMVSTLRIFRLAKLARVLVLLEKFPELHMILRGIFCTIKSIFWGMCLLTTIVLIWSILGVQLIHPINKDIDYGDCERCSRAFAGVFNSFLTIFQTVVAGDSWGQLAIPIIEHSPFALAYFFSVFVSIGLLVLNLILATTVERASAAKYEDEAALNRQRVEEKRKSYQDASKRLQTLCREMDADESGALTLKELEEGYGANPEFRGEMEAMDIKEDDMKMMFKLLDTDGSGDVNYREFVESLHMLKTRDSHTMIMFTYYLVEDIVAKSTAQLRLLTSQQNGFVSRISDEVASRAISELGSLLETSTKSTKPCETWPHEARPDPPRAAAWPGAAAADPAPAADRASDQQAADQRAGRRPARAGTPASAAPDGVPAALSNKDDGEIKVSTGSPPFAAYCCQRGTGIEVNAHDELVVDDTLEKTKDASERQDRSGLTDTRGGNLGVAVSLAL